MNSKHCTQFSFLSFFVENYCVMQKELVERHVPPQPQQPVVLQRAKNASPKWLFYAHMNNGWLAKCITWKKRIMHPQQPRPPTTMVMPNRPQPPEGSGGKGRDRCVHTSICEGALCRPSNAQQVGTVPYSSREGPVTRSSNTFWPVTVNIKCNTTSWSQISV